MDIRIIKKNVSYCTICDDVKNMREVWDEGQRLLVEKGEQEEAVQFPGVPGYSIKDADDYTFICSDICENCMHTLMKGVTIIHEQNLTGISLNSRK